MWLPEGFKLRVPHDASFYTFILKIAARCNLACPYCYVYEGPDQSWRDRPKFMSEETAHDTFSRIAEHISEKNLDEVVVTFHGGEPLLAGVDRFRRYLQIAQEHIAVKLDLSVQTNGTLLSNEYLDLFAEYGVKIGMSIDGDRQANDRYRKFKNGRSSFERVISAIELVDSKPEWSKLLTGYLAVVDLNNDPKRLFRFMSSLDCRGFDVLLPDCNHEARPFRPESDTNNTAYGRWMAELFDAWLESGTNIEVCYIEEIMAMLFGQPSTREHIGSQFADLIIVESDGEIEGVDTLKMVSREATKLGLNVHTNSFSEALLHESVGCRLVGYEALCEECRSCNFLDFCGGGYLPHRYKKETGFLNPSVYCNDIKFLISHIWDTLKSELNSDGRAISLS